MNISIQPQSIDSAKANCLESHIYSITNLVLTSNHLKHIGLGQYLECFVIYQGHASDTFAQTIGFEIKFKYKPLTKKDCALHCQPFFYIFLAIAGLGLLTPY